MVYPRLRELRLSNGYSEETLGCLLTKSSHTYHKIENGDAELEVNDLILLCGFYRTSADYLTGRTDNPAPYPPVPANGENIPESLTMDTACRVRFSLCFAVFAPPFLKNSQFLPHIPLQSYL